MKIDAELSIMKDLSQRFGNKWMYYCIPEWVHNILYRERNFCIYCGKLFVENKFKNLEIDLDHMNPLSLGGDHSLANTIIVCSSCNRRKRDKNFSDWLFELRPSNRRLAERIYYFKHGYRAKNFVPNRYDNLFEISFSQQENILITNVNDFEIFKMKKHIDYLKYFERIGNNIIKSTLLILNEMFGKNEIRIARKLILNKSYKKRIFNMFSGDFTKAPI